MTDVLIRRGEIHAGRIRPCDDTCRDWNVYDPRIAKDGWQILGTEAWKSSGYQTAQNSVLSMLYTDLYLELAFLKSGLLFTLI